MGTKTCIECGQRLTGHGTPLRCRSCAARQRYVKLHGKPPERPIYKCAVCGKKFTDYASNRPKGQTRTCSVECRAAWTGVVNSISRGGDGRRRSKAEKDKDYYVRVAPRIRKRANAAYWKNRESILARLKAKGDALKAEVINAYGGKCACCGEAHVEFLTIDHTQGDGAAHRAKCGKGRGIYRDIVKQGFPKDKYQCLCLNCNIALGFYGYCPHHPEIKRAVNHAPRNPGRKRTVR